MILYYSLMNLFRGRGSNLLKIASLTAGLAVALVLFARVTFELNVDKHYRDVDHLMRIKVWYTIGGEKRNEPSTYIMEPLPKAIAENFPEEVESTTLVSRWPDNVYYYGSYRHIINYPIYSDENYFRTMGLDVLQGNPDELKGVDVMFISESVARQLFGDENPIGKILNMSRNHPLTIRGIYKDIPETSTLRSNIVISMPTLFKVEGDVGGWGQNDSYQGYVRLRGTDPSAINARMDEMVLKYMPDNGKKDLRFEYFLSPVEGDYASQKEIRMMVLIMSLLAVVVLAIAAMNYVLASISSLAQRAKGIGVHKCSGAGNGHIIGIFLLETGTLILISLIAVILLLINFRETIEDMVSAKLSTLFALDTLWVPALIVLVLFMLIGFLPGQIFARIPVSHVFRRYTEKKNGWKRPLLFIQFMGVSFIAGLLTVILMQYNHIIHSDLGYNPENVAYAYTDGIEDPAFMKDELRRMPAVEAVAMSAHDLMNGWGALPIRNSGGIFLFTSRWNAFDKDYLPLMQIELVEGKNIDGPNQFLINQKFVEKHKMQDSPVGKPFPDTKREGIIVGVMKDFPVDNLYEEVKPVMVESSLNYENGYSYRCVHVRVRDLNTETLSLLNKKVDEMYPDHDIKFKPLTETIIENYQAAKRFCDAVMLATVVIILITIFGLIGYVSDEVRRRSKEIAVRKVNGATAKDILSLLSGNLAYLALPAVLLGVVGSWVVGSYWLEQFYEKVELQTWIFISIALFVLILIIVTVIIKAWRVANENPVKSIQNE